jgi:hypothetical protein
MDYLDLMQGKYFQLQCGKYYKKIPAAQIPSNDTIQDPDTVGVPFDYETLDPTEWHYKQLLQNLIEAQAATVTIKTKARLDWRNNGFISAMDGHLYKIISVTEDVRSATHEARALFAVPVGAEYVIRLVEIDNPWGIS